MKNISKQILIFLSTAFLFSIISCSNLVQDTSTSSNNTDSNSSAGEVAYITLGSSTKFARDIFPSDDDLDKTKLTNITLTGTWAPGTANSREETLIDNAGTWSAAIASNVQVQTGNWIFTLTAKMNEIDFSGTLGTASEPIAITKSGTTTSLDFILSATTEGSGGLALTVTVGNKATALPSGTLLQVNITLKNSSGVTKYSDNKDYTGSNVSFSRSLSNSSEKLAAGIYDLEIKLTIDELSYPLNTYKDKLHIVAGIVTTKELSLNVNPVYDISYEYHDGTITEGSAGPAQFSRKSTTANLPTLSKTGYTFLGWYDADTDGNEVTQVSNTTVNTSASVTTYYARFQLIDYNITFNGTSGATVAGGATLPTSYNYESEDITLPSLSKNYYTFDGWCENQDASGNGTGTVVTEIANHSTEPRIFYAKWTPISYTITYTNIDDEEVTGDETLPASYTVESEDITLPGLTKTGYIFDGWYSDDGFALTDKINGVAITSGSHVAKTFHARFIDTIYIKSDGSEYSATADGTRTTAPLNSVASAVSKIIAYANNGVNWKINVIGELTGVQELSSSITSDYGASITLQGNTGNTTDKLNGNYDPATTKGTVLKILAKIPVTIKNLKITGGIPDGGYQTGGGVTIYGNTDVIFDTGALITGNNYASGDTNGPAGGGVYIRASGKLTMKTGSLVDNNSAMYGGGIAVYGTFIMEGGKISENTSTQQGGGIFIREEAATCDIRGGEISSNTGSLGPAIGGVNYASTLYISGGEIKNNISTSSSNSDAAVHLMPLFTCSITGGTFTSNEKGSIFITTDTAVPMSGSFYVGPENPIICQSMNNKPGKISITSPLVPPESCADGIMATVTELVSGKDTYVAGDQLIDFSNWSDGTISNSGKVEQMAHLSMAASPDGKEWKLDADGKLEQDFIGDKPAPTAVGDIVFKDGSAIAYAEGLTLSEKQKNAAIAVIFYAGGDTQLGSKILGIGKDNSYSLFDSSTNNISQSHFKWCGGTLSSTKISDIQITISATDSNYDVFVSTASATVPTGGNYTGKDDWEKIVALDSTNTTTENVATYYPAFNYVLKYAENQNLIGTYASGWYMPSIVEYFSIHNNKTTINNALQAIEGTLLADADKIGNDESVKCRYWTSSQAYRTDTNVSGSRDSYYSTSAWNVTAGTGQIFDCGKTNTTTGMVCVIRDFTE